MGVDKQHAAAFLATFAIIFNTMGTSFGGLVMENLYARDVTTDKGHKADHLKMTYTGTIKSPWAWAYWISKACFAASFAVFWTDYDNAGISNEKVSDFYLVACLFATALGCIWLMPHLLALGFHINGKPPGTWTWWVVFFSFIVNEGLAITLMSLYFAFGKTIAGILSIGWVIGVFLIYIWWQFVAMKGRSDITPSGTA